MLLCNHFNSGYGVVFSHGQVLILNPKKAAKSGSLITKNTPGIIKMVAFWICDKAFIPIVALQLV